MLFTVITINYNNKKGLLRTLSNVADLKRKYSFEYVVVDGNSSDGSKDLLAQYRTIIDICISERDSGIYNAMNKGVNVSTGKYINFLNSGDCLFFNEMDSVIDKLKSNSCDFLYGDYFIKRSNERYIWKNNKTIKHLWKGFFCHQSIFTRRNLLIKYPLNEKLKICGDSDFVLNIIKNKQKIEKVNVPFAIIEPGGVSDINRIRSLIEQWKVTKEKKIKSSIVVTMFFMLQIIKNMLIKLIRW
ncbi:hypothetical protein A7H89_16800 [Escherichia coli]|uniref:glycosyltransferase family 2 protein n=1 Tax=Escherichia coli TaxID=562 RepID=UPI000BB82614|nr:glycosyltransferase family 2 protein [Escherichia coli]PBS28604.1 hypothetical protein A7H85_11950 [Escherichia coli]PBS33054.1 hypothetical protein A7H86_11955 [Escherichia coli]PBS39428.1 hypothetical protein A7H87_05275 [Escherichia coli]PBS43876.1 hypothetical protein A7H88_09980 [Escherichia coli]PBS47124.1 hypothetical protein A7H89_16800 [Escherichia coli]